MFPRSFRPQMEELGSRILPSANPAITISDVTRVEGQSGQTEFVFTVSLSQASSKSISVNYATADGSAKTAEGDYVSTSGALKFAPGETTKTITVLVNADGKVEANETFFVNLSRAKNAVLSDAQGLATILNDDEDPPPPDSGVPTIPPDAGTTPPQHEVPPDNRDDF